MESPQESRKIACRRVPGRSPGDRQRSPMDVSSDTEGWTVPVADGLSDARPPCADFSARCSLDCRLRFVMGLMHVPGPTAYTTDCTTKLFSATDYEERSELGRLRLTDMGVMRVPIYLDRHDLNGSTAAGVAELHRKDLELQTVCGRPHYCTTGRGTAFCLIDAPDIETAMRVHQDAHGGIASDVIEVQLSAAGGVPRADCRPAVARQWSRDGRRRASNRYVHRHRRFHRHDHSLGDSSRRRDGAGARRDGASGAGRVPRPQIKHTGDGIMARVRQRSAAVSLRVCHPAGVRGVQTRNSAREVAGPHRHSMPQSRSKTATIYLALTVQIAARICQTAAATVDRRLGNR